MVEWPIKSYEQGASFGKFLNTDSIYFMFFNYSSSLLLSQFWENYVFSLGIWFSSKFSNLFAYLHFS